MTRKRPPTPFEEEMGTRLQRLRQAAGLTQKQLAERAGVPFFSLQNWEYGRRTMLADAVVKLARALGVSTDELLIGPPKKRRPRRMG